MCAPLAARLLTLLSLLQIRVNPVTFFASVALIWGFGASLWCLARLGRCSRLHYSSSAVHIGCVQGIPFSWQRNNAPAILAVGTAIASCTSKHVLIVAFHPRRSKPVALAVMHV